MSSGFLPSLLLSLSLGLSWNEFVLTFRRYASLSGREALRTVVANAVCLSALGLAFGNQSLWAGMVIVLAGVILSFALKNAASRIVAVALSALCFAAYLHIASAAA